MNDTPKSPPKLEERKWRPFYPEQPPLLADFLVRRAGWDAPMKWSAIPPHADVRGLLWAPIEETP